MYFSYNIDMTNNVSGCGRSPNVKCIDWHSLSEEEYQKKLVLYKEKMKKKLSYFPKFIKYTE